MRKVKMCSRSLCLLAVCASFVAVTFAQENRTMKKPSDAPQRMMAAAKDYPAARSAVLVREWTRARDYTREYLDAMPEAGIAFKPVPEVRSFAEQMLHLAGGNFMFASTASGRANPYKDKNLEKMPEMMTKAALTKIVTESYDFVLAALAGMTEAQLDESTAVFGMTRPRAAVLAAAFEHQTHHRGQTTIYLRLKGVTPPREKLF